MEIICVNMAYNDSRNPLRALQDSSRIVVRLKDGTEYTGDLEKYDNFMNLIISNAEIISRDKDVDFQVPEPSIGKAEEIFIRGNNVLFILPKN